MRYRKGKSLQLVLQSKNPLGDSCNRIDQRQRALCLPILFLLNSRHFALSSKNKSQRKKGASLHGLPIIDAAPQEQVLQSLRPPLASSLSANNLPRIPVDRSIETVLGAHVVRPDGNRARPKGKKTTIILRAGRRIKHVLDYHPRIK